MKFHETTCLFAIMLLLAGLSVNPVLSANCGIGPVTVKPGTGGFTSQIEFAKPGIGITFQWKLGSDKASYEMELTTSNVTNDWVAIGFCLENDPTQSGSCMDNCDFAVLWKPKDRKLPTISDCHLQKSEGFQKFSCDEGQDFKLQSIKVDGDTTFHGRFTRKIDTGDLVHDIKLEDKMFIIGGSGELLNKDDETETLSRQNGIKHYSQCGKSAGMIFPGKPEAESGSENRGYAPTKSHGHILTFFSVLLLVFFGSQS